MAEATAPGRVAEEDEAEGGGEEEEDEEKEGARGARERSTWARTAPRAAAPAATLPNTTLAIAASSPWSTRTTDNGTLAVSIFLIANDPTVKVRKGA